MTTQEVKDQVAQEYGFKDWEQLYAECCIQPKLLAQFINKAMQKYASAKIEEQLILAAEHAEINNDDYSKDFRMVNKDSILNCPRVEV